MPIESIISNELQLGQQLNHSVVGERAKFALLLALMSPNVEEQAQFHLVSNRDVIDNQGTPNLAHQFKVARAQALVSDDEGELQSLQTGQLAIEHSVIDARFKHCLNPEPLSFKLDKTQGIERDVFDNLDFVAARKLSGHYHIDPIEKVVVNDLIERQQTYAAQLN